MYKIGLTGGICTGKSFVLEILNKLGCFTVRADEIAKGIIFSKNSEIMPKIIETFGDTIYDEKQGINKEEFSRILFEDAEKRDFINNIVHPLVIARRDELLKGIEETGVYRLFVYESALLVEAGTYKGFDKIIVVYASPGDQLKRLMDRDKIDEKEAESKIKSQFPLSEKLKVANYTIDTSGSFQNAEAQTLETFHLMLKDLDIKE